MVGLCFMKRRLWEIRCNCCWWIDCNLYLTLFFPNIDRLSLRLEPATPASSSTSSKESFYDVKQAMGQLNVSPRKAALKSTASTNDTKFVPGHTKSRSLGTKWVNSVTIIHHYQQNLWFQMICSLFSHHVDAFRIQIRSARMKQLDFYKSITIN